MESVTNPLTGWLLENPAARVPLTLAVLGALFVVPLIALAAYMLRLGSRAIAGRRFPPGGYQSFRQQDPVTGDAAVRQGRIIRILAMLLVAGAIALAVVLWRLGSLLTQRLA
jgi:hypothetical protein